MSTPLQTTIDRSKYYACWSNHNDEMSDIYRHDVSLYKHPGGRFFLVAEGGLPFHRATKWITAEQARQFIAEHAMDPMKGYGYTDEEVAVIMAGESMHGSRDFDGGLLPRQHLADF